MNKRSNSAKSSIRGLALPLLALVLVLMLVLTGCSGEGLSAIWNTGGMVGAVIPSSDILNTIGDWSNEDTADSASDFLTLVNPWTPMEEGYVPPLDSLSDGTQVDARCIDDLRALLIACREDGCQPYICSAYRTYDEQAALFENKISRLRAEGYPESELYSLAAAVVAVPGTSEHQLGLAFDIIDGEYTALDEGQENTATNSWLMENSWRYGFILRYPKDKSDVTGIIYEPWHYRYVGREAAAEIYESGLCLEEWLGQG